MSNPIIHVTSFNEFKYLVGLSKPTIVKAEADWCGPCRMIAPVVQKLAEANPDVQFLSFDVDEQSDIAENLSIRSMPTFFLFHLGQKVDQFSGAAPPQVGGFYFVSLLITQTLYRSKNSLRRLLT